MEVISVGASEKKLTSFPIHEHGYWEILLNFEGHGIIQIDQSELPFEGGDICVIPPGIPHGKTSKDGFRDISMIIKNMRPIGDAGVKIIKDDASNTVLSMLRIALNIYTNPQEINAARSEVILNSIGDAIYQILSALFSADRHRDLRVDGFIERMEANISKPEFDISAEIEKLGYSKGYFRKVFKDVTGESPVSYFNRIRVETAEKQFHHYGPSRTVKDIGLSCGFTDPYYFSRVFKKVTGVSPSAYLEQLGEFDMEQIEHMDSSESPIHN